MNHRTSRGSPLRLAALVYASLLVSACGPTVLDFRNADICNGKIYARGADEPFSGKLTNIPDTRILATQKGFNLFTQSVQGALAGNTALDRLLFTPSLCDVKAKKGVLDGDVLCSSHQGKVKRLQMAFKDGVLHGSIKLFDVTPENDVVASAVFEEGLLEGKEEVFSPTSQKLLHRFRWEAGAQDGDEEKFDPESGKQIGLFPFKNGKIDGEVNHWTSDGKRVIYRATLSDGNQNGVEESLYIASGKLFRRVEWKLGKKEGTVQQWDTDGKLTFNAIFVNDQDVTPRPGPGSNLIWSEERERRHRSCVGSWERAFRGQGGEMSDVSPQERAAWELACDDDKTPPRPQ
jgi:antitoxin component YwqK of YwqJK toxin-antitoxin module